MLFRCVFLFCALACGSGAHAADIQINSNENGYTLEISGSIRRGDLETLSGIFKEEGTFPASTRISSEGGDLGEAMRLGELYRDAHLSAIAVKHCDSACFLWLLGAVSRTIATEVSSGLRLPEMTDEIMNYLVTMDVPADVALDLVTKKGGRAAPFNRDRFESEIGERPGSYSDWLVQHCGEVTEQERIDHRRVQSAGFLKVLRQMQAENPEREDLAPIIGKYEGIAIEAGRFSEDYRQALLDKWLDIRQCQRDLVKTDQERLIAGL